MPAGQDPGKPARCARCGQPLSRDNRSQTTGYCDSCQAQVEGEIRSIRQIKGK